MSLLEALSAPGDYTRGVLSGQPGERVRGSDVFPGEAGPATATNILSDPVNWIGLGLAAALMGGAGAKAYQRAARWSDMGRRDFMGAMGGLGAKLMLPIPKATPEERFLANLKNFLNKDASRMESIAGEMSKLAQHLDNDPIYLPKGPYTEQIRTSPEDYFLHGSSYIPGEGGIHSADVARNVWESDLVDEIDGLRESAADARWTLKELEERGLEIVRDRKLLRDLLRGEGDFFNGGWHRDTWADIDEMAAMGLGRKIDDSTIHWDDSLPLNPQGVQSMFERWSQIEAGDPMIQSVRMSLRDLAERAMKRKGRGVERAMRNARDVAAGKAVERHVPRSTYPLLGALGGYNLLANVELE